MSRPDEPGSELDALLARPTPQPGDDGGEPDAGSARSARGRLETWLRGPAPASERELGAGDGPVWSGLERRDDAGGASAGMAGLEGAGDAGEDWQPAMAPTGSPTFVDVSQPSAMTESSGDALRELPVERIAPNRYQPRRHFDEDTLQSLAESIEALGVLQPVVVRALDDGRFELVAGERRWRAAQLAGVRTIPALIRDTDDQGALEQAIVENLHRQDLNPLEEAAAYRELSADFGLTQDEVARRVGKSRSAVANVLRLLQLAPEVQRLLAAGELSAGHARAILGLDHAEAQIALAERVIDQELSVRQTEEAVRAGSGAGTGAGPGSGPAGGPGSGKSVGALEVQMLLEERLETRVDVLEAGRGGRLVIRFADGEDLQRLVELIGAVVPEIEP